MQSRTNFPLRGILDGLLHLSFPERMSALLTVCLQLAYLLFSVGYPNPAFGLNQLHWLPPSLVASALMSTWVIAALAPRFTHVNRGKLDVRSLSPLWRVAAFAIVSGVAVIGFALLRNRFVNRDALTTLQMIPREVPIRGAYLTHDSMLDLYIHSRFWYYANGLLGWDVRQSYHVLSSIAGGLFVFGLLVLAARLRPLRPLLFLLFMASGGYIQLFFGDIENYSFVAVCILAYVCASYCFLHDGATFVAPSAALSIAMMFHLVAGWLLPSYAYLIAVCLKRGGPRPLAKGLLAFVLVLASVLVFFHFNGLPIQRLFTTSHAFALARGEAAEYLNTPSLDYYIQIVNLVLLLFPAVILLPALVAGRRIEISRFNIFLIVACLSGLAFLLVWNAQLGVYQDWNLFAPLFVPVVVLLSWNVARRSSEGVASTANVAFGLTSIMHTFTWIVTNHFMQNY